MEKNQELHRKYELLDLIGTGGMAEVYRAKLVGQQGFEKPLVIKQLLADVADDPEVVENFIDEARLAALLHHENIACIYDFGDMDGSYFIAMEYLFGKDLHSVLAKARSIKHPIGVNLALYIASQICAGMDYAHNLTDLKQQPLGIIHRDLTPHNVFLTYDGKVKIIDFGVAKAELYDNRTRAGVVKGKVSYMSPEQLEETDVDRRSDIFSIGILLYEMISGERMYQGDTATLIQKCMSVDYTPLEEIMPRLDYQVYVILHMALQKNANRRYQSCSEMLDDISDFFLGQRERLDSRSVRALLLELFQEEYREELRRFSPESALEQNEGTEDLADDDKTVIMAPPVGETRGWFRGFGRVGILAVLGIGFCLIILASINMALDKKSTAPKNLEKQDEPKVAVSEKAPEKPLIKIQPLQVPVEVENETKLDDAEIMDRAVNILVAEGEAALAAHKLTKPEDGSAYGYFKKALELDPENEKARAGMQRISEKYADIAEKNLENGDKKEALIRIEQGLEVEPESGKLLAMKKEIAEQEQNKIEQLYQKAIDSIRAGRYTTPAEESAYRYLLEIERIQPSSPLVYKGKRKIADIYSSLGDKALQNMNLQRARKYTEAGLKVMPDHPGLLELRSDLQMSKPAIFLKGLARSLRPIFN